MKNNENSNQKAIFWLDWQIRQKLYCIETKCDLRKENFYKTPLAVSVGDDNVQTNVVY